jgi:beta-aspartyl-peptidase (threonine type)
LVGSGAYADDGVGAATATGEGEQLMKVLISKSACDYIHGGMTAQEAADASVSLLAHRTAGLGGVVVLDPQGGIGISHNTLYLAHATVDAGGTITASMSPDPVTST